MQNDFITRAGAQKARFCKTWSRAAKKRASCRGGAWRALFRPAACKKAAGANGFCDALRSYVALRVSWRILAPLLLVGAAMWQPPAAKEGQGDCDFRLRTVRLRAQCSVRLHGSRTPVALRATYAGPPWILLYPLKRRRSARGRWRRGLAATRQARGRLGALRRISAVVWEAAGAGRCAAGAGMI